MSYIFVYLFLLFIIKKCESNIIIQFKIKENPINTIESNKENSLIHNLLFNTYYSKIEIGTPAQIIEAQISSQKNGIILKENSCLSSEYYNKKYSSSIKEKSHCDNNDNILNYYKEISINETISFSNYNSNDKYKIKNFPLLYFKQLSEKEIDIIKRYGRKINLYENLFDIFHTNNNDSLLENNKDGKACLLIGMNIYSSYNCLPNENLISYLNRNNIIKNSNWMIKYYNKNENDHNKYDGEFIIGTMPHEYDSNIYKKEQLSITNALYYKSFQYWQIYFNDIYFFPLDYKLDPNINLDYLNIDNPENKKVCENKINVALNSYARFNFDINAIFGPFKYYELINEHFFSKYPDKCKYNIEEKKYGIFTCEKNINIDNFPSLYFYHKIYNYTFELNFKDLFEDINDKKYFLIAFDEYEPDIWKLGTIFLRKYLFVFNTEEKTIGFYNNKIQINILNTKIFNNYLWIIFIIFSGLVGFLIGKKIYQKIRTKRFNELNDNFIYTSQKEPAIALEMSSKKQ